MSNDVTPAIAADLPAEVACLILPMAGQTLLAPSETVAEIILFRQPIQLANTPTWLLGEIEWRNQRVPVISYEVLNGGELSAATYSRVAIFNNTGVSDQLTFFAMPTQGAPSLSRINKDMIERSSADAKPFDLLPVTINKEEFVIPDVMAIEQAYADWLVSN